MLRGLQSLWVKVWGAESSSDQIEGRLAMALSIRTTLYRGCRKGEREVYTIIGE